MMKQNDLYFTNREFGNLYLEEVLVHFDIPLLFVCINDDTQRYAVLCIDGNEKPFRYLTVKVKEEKLIQMLQNQISMRELIQNPLDNKVWYITCGDVLSSDVVESGFASEITNEDLPQAGAYFEIYNQRIESYISLLKQAIIERSIAENIMECPNLYRRSTFDGNNETWNNSICIEQIENHNQYEIIFSVLNDILPSFTALKEEIKYERTMQFC